MLGLWDPMKVFMSIGNLYEEEWKVQLGSHSSAFWREKKCLDSLSFLGKTSRTLSGKAQVTGFWCGTGGCCQKGAMLTDTQQSLFSPKTCGSCKNNPQTPYPQEPLLPSTLQLTGIEICFFLRVSLLGMICAWVWLCKMRGVKHFGTNVSTTAKQLALISMRLS